MHDKPTVDAVAPEAGAGAGSGAGGAGPDLEPEIVPLESAAGTSMNERVREAMAEGGVHHVCEVIAQAIAAMVAHATGDTALEVDAGTARAVPGRPYTLNPKP